MTEQPAGFFSRAHDQLLGLATWLKFLAWVSLIVSLILPIARYTQIQYTYTDQQAVISPFVTMNFIDTMKEHPDFALSVIVDVAYHWLLAFITFLVLRSIGLALNMIVETDINYREQSPRLVQNEQ